MYSQEHVLTSKACLLLAVEKQRRAKCTIATDEEMGLAPGAYWTAEDLKQFTPALGTLTQGHLGLSRPACYADLFF